MSIGQFFGILWAHRLIIVASALICFLIGTVTVFTVQPRYEASSRVMLDEIKPDPVTGQVIASAFMRTYIKTQTEMIKDQQVARQVVRDLNLANDKQFRQAYRSRKDGLDLDFEHWAGQLIIKGTSADVIPASNILEITYASKSPERAKQIADGLLKAYVGLTLQTRRETARRNADWYDAQAAKARSILFAAESTKANYERESGIILQDDKVDIDSARLNALAAQNVAPIISTNNGGQTGTAVQLAQLDAEIADATRTLGPNHPQLLAAKRRREALATQLAQERNQAATAASAAMSASTTTSALLQQQKAKVMAQREKVERLRLMQDEIDLRRDQYNKAVTRSAQLRQEADIADAGVTPLSNAITPTSPVFPKKALIMGASPTIGAALGLVLALLLELIGRRVRGADDLSLAAAAPVLAIIHNPEARKRNRLDWRRAFPARGRDTPRAAQA
jgi:uncharacterized protein involved in exopolysaccharide biosynthesis